MTTPLLRRLLLKASRSGWLERRLTQRRFARRALRRFLPGEDLESALAAARTLHHHGLSAVLTSLGEHVRDRAEAEATADHYSDVLNAVGETGLDVEISVKLTQLGLDVDPDLALEAVRRLARLARRARAGRRTVWIDMESSVYTDRTLELFGRARAEFPNVGVCIQAYLRRSHADLDSLIDRFPDGVILRLVKGAYDEPQEIAFRRKRDVDAAYLDLARRALRHAAESTFGRTALATHDTRLVETLRTWAREMEVSADAYEFQMLYGIRRDAQRRLSELGDPIRVLISYGTAWYPWFMRRLAERPANLFFLARHLFSG